MLDKWYTIEELVAELNHQVKIRTYLEERMRSLAQIEKVRGKKKAIKKQLLKLNEISYLAGFKEEDDEDNTLGRYGFREY